MWFEYSRELIIGLVAIIIASFSFIINPLSLAFQQAGTGLPDGFIRWDYGLTIGILTTFVVYLVIKIDKKEKAYQNNLDKKDKDHREVVKEIVDSYKETVSKKDGELKELNDRVLEAFVSVQTTLVAVGESNNSVIKRISEVLENHRFEMKTIIQSGKSS